MPDGHDGDLTRTHRPSASSGPPPPVATWGSFRLLEELGHGAFGRVYHAWDATLARDIALKIIRLPDETRAAAALQEGRMLARIRHRNVVIVYGAQQIGEEVAFWMELIQGRHLGTIVREQGPFGPEEATIVGISLCQALAAVHNAGLIHRDVKANNVMREAGGRIVLMDFGTGQETALASGAELAGTPVYMAPEVLNGDPPSPASDLYSLGVLLFYVVTGDYPVPGKSVLDLVVAHRSGQRRLLTDRRPDLPDAFTRVVERALAPRADARPASAGAMMADLARALPGTGAWEGRLATALGHSGSIRGVFARDATAIRRRRLLRYVALWVIAFASVIAAAGVFGFLTSVAFNVSLQREAFSSDTAAGWWVIGARSLVAPAIYAASIVIVARLGVAAWRALCQLVPPLGRLTAALVTAVGAAWKRLGGSAGSSIAHWLLVVHLAALFSIWWRFYDLLNAVVFLNDVAPAMLNALDTENTQSWLYRPTLTLLIVTMVSAWYGLLSRPHLAKSVGSTTRVAGAGIMLVTLLFLEVPYRLLYQNEMRRVDYGGRRCYDLGRNGGEVLLYCPDSPPRIRIISGNDPTPLKDNSVTENIFSSAAPSQ